jgi:tRNA(Ile)-lysidine synthase
VPQAENFRAGFEDRLLAALGRYRASPVFLAALSGGADSTALAAVLAALRDSAGTGDSVETGGSGLRFPFVFRCLHVNHNIRSREECAEDERQVVSLCKTLSVPLRIHRVRPGAVRAYARVRGTGLEAAARHFRYAALRSEAHRIGAGAILVAHTQDDLLETILMAVLRGSGPAGLGAMTAESGLPGVPIVRPLLGITRAGVIRYLAERGLAYTIDSSNDDVRFLRNRIRRLLVPFLDREFPRWQTPLLSLNKTQAGVAAFLASEASIRLPWKRDGEILFLEEKDFFAQSPVLREEALFQALDRLASEPRILPESRIPPEAETSPDSGAFRPRRAAIRPFAAGEKTVCDLGSFRLEKKNGRIIVRAWRDFISGETGDSFLSGIRNSGEDANSGFGGIRSSRRAFSVLIKSPGLYKLETLTLRSLPADVMTEGSVSSCGFFASFPLVLRSLERKESPAVEVRDRDGRAAIVGFQGEIVWVRKGGSRNGSYIGVDSETSKSVVPGRSPKTPGG